jgi:hypothetical protein
VRSIVIPCFIIQGYTLPWTRCFAHSNNGGRPVCMGYMRRLHPDARRQRSAGHLFRLNRVKGIWWHATRRSPPTPHSETNYEPFNSSSARRVRSSSDPAPQLPTGNACGLLRRSSFGDIARARGGLRL